MKELRLQDPCELEKLLTLAAAFGATLDDEVFKPDPALGPFPRKCFGYFE
jgi:hypothetical protein